MQTRRCLQALMLLLLGFYSLDNILSVQIYTYVNRFGWLTWFSAYALLLLVNAKLVDLIQGLRTADEDTDSEKDESCERNGMPKDSNVPAPSWLGLAIFAFPLIMDVVATANPACAPAVDALDVSGTSNNGQPKTVVLKEATKPPNERSILDWVHAFSNTNNIEEFNGQLANVIGFVYRDTRFKDRPQQFMVARFVCCDKDENPIAVTVQFPDAAALTDNSWIHVKGIFQVQDIDGQQTPILIRLPLPAGVLAPMGILLSPAAGALLMSISTIVVAINAQLLKGLKLTNIPATR